MALDSRSPTSGDYLQLRLKVNVQPIELPLFKAEKFDPSVGKFLELLAIHGHLTRRRFAELTGWTDRDVRALAEAAGEKVVRGQKGFCLFDAATIDEALDAAQDAISQGKKMIRYGVALKRRIHGRVG
jgi:hypothetical protein